MGCCENYGLLLGAQNTRCRVILRTPKGTIILTTTHIGIVVLVLGRYLVVGYLDPWCQVGPSQGSSTHYLRFLVPKTTPVMVFDQRAQILRNQSLTPSFNCKQVRRWCNCTDGISRSVRGFFLKTTLSTWCLGLCNLLPEVKQHGMFLPCYLGSEDLHLLCSPTTKE